jgi:hypothetical protein
MSRQKSVDSDRISNDHPLLQRVIRESAANSPARVGGIRPVPRQASRNAAIGDVSRRLFAHGMIVDPFETAESYWRRVVLPRHLALHGGTYLRPSAACAVFDLMQEKGAHGSLAQHNPSARLWVAMNRTRPQTLVHPVSLALRSPPRSNLTMESRPDHFQTTLKVTYFLIFGVIERSG